MKLARPIQAAATSGGGCAYKIKVSYRSPARGQRCSLRRCHVSALGPACAHRVPGENRDPVKGVHAYRRPLDGGELRIVEHQA